MGERVSDDLLQSLFSERSNTIIKYHHFLQSQGISQGLLGPREEDRLWTRHILNSVLLTQLIPNNSRVLDIGTGAGLPGIPVALADDTLCVNLIESMSRRVKFLAECLDFLGIKSVLVNHSENTPARDDIFPRISVFHGRAEEPAIINFIPPVDFVIARAVSSLDNLAILAKPFLKPGGELLALKGEKIHQELIQSSPILKKLNFNTPRIEHLTISNTDITGIVARVKVN